MIRVTLVGEDVPILVAAKDFFTDEGCLVCVDADSLTVALFAVGEWVFAQRVVAKDLPS